MAHQTHYLAQYGQEYLVRPETDLTSPQTMYNFLSVCNDMHRKFTKERARGQKTDLVVTEHALYSAVRSDKNQLDREKLNQYFSLFAPKKERVETAEVDNKPVATPI
jgi:hypothetical protein